ncbi:hypothetical protein J2X28_001839 [Kocuria rhizophila]|nr:hypothetical protein [Kocuria rhizophila]
MQKEPDVLRPGDDDAAPPVPHLRPLAETDAPALTR